MAGKKRKSQVWASVETVGQVAYVDLAELEAEGASAPASGPAETETGSTSAVSEGLSQVDCLIQQLIRFDTSSGSRPEKPCIDHIQTMLTEAGIYTKRFARDENRPNLLAVLPADMSPVTGGSLVSYHALTKDSVLGELPPLLLYGHADVVPVTDQSWSVPPFSGLVKDGCLWGRGAIDMKGQVAMFIQLFLKLKKEKTALPFELRLLIVSDEEGSGHFGMRFLVQEHPEIFTGVRWAFGEIGGFSITIAGKKFYPVMIAEKQYCHIRITAEGKGGHGSLAFKGTAVEQLSVAMQKLCGKRLPVRITPAVSHMVKAMAKALGGVQGMVLRGLLHPGLTDTVLRLLGDNGSLFDPLLHNHVNVTMVEGGTAPNVVPARVSCDCDLRIVPGCSAQEAVRDVRQLIGEEFSIEIVEYDQGSSAVDMTLFSGLEETLKAFDPEGYTVPFVLSAVTDGRHLAPLGIQTYGFTPMAVPDDYDFTVMAHGADERIPLGAADFGVEVLYGYIKERYAQKFSKEETR